MPHWKHEIAAGIKEGVVVCGVDEVGRGPLAGPVVACAVILPQDLSRSFLRRVKDSKQIEREEREEVAAILREKVAYCVGKADVAEIDSINILRASHLAMLRAYEGLPSRPAHALVDGNQPPNLPCPITCIISGDAISLSIAAASIIAKVERDKIMRELAETHPLYGWETNVGYSTKEHLAAIREHGPTPFHRRSFRPIYQLQLPID
ncbi:MAG TPA: ribonuclease HII [Dongiaceae bacterium]|nr:ribonuclease HII [Dongiaceae bacterium]